MLRRTSKITTKKAYTTGSGSGTWTSGSNLILITGANFYTGNIDVGRRIKLSGSTNYFTIRQLSSITTCNIDTTYDSTTVSATGTYSILGQEEYNLPIQAGHRMFLWHNEYGYPYKMTYVTEQDFREQGIIDTTESIPTHYRMWGENMVFTQISSDTNISISSTNATADTATSVSIFGTVAGYPDYETLSLNGTTVVTGSKKFSYVERVVKNNSTTGRVIISDSQANRSIAIIPVGDVTGGILYKKIQVYPLPNSVFDINVWYYKDPYRLVNDGDIHELGQDFDEAVILLATAKIKYQTDQAEADKFMLLYQDEIRNLRKTNMDKIDFFPTLRRPRDSHGGRDMGGLTFQQVGPFFGPSSRR